MNSIDEALNILIGCINIAYNRNIYTMEETHNIYSAITYLNRISEEQVKKQTKDNKK